VSSIPRTTAPTLSPFPSFSSIQSQHFARKRSIVWFPVSKKYFKHDLQHVMKRLIYENLNNGRWQMIQTWAPRTYTYSGWWERSFLNRSHCTSRCISTNFIWDSPIFRRMSRELLHCLFPQLQLRFFLWPVCVQSVWKLHLQES